MTDTHEKVRALFLTALMVFSVFAGTVAFSGAAAAAANDDASIDGAVHYATVDDTDNSGILEVSINNSAASIDGNTEVFVGLEDGTNTSVTIDQAASQTGANGNGFILEADTPDVFTNVQNVTIVGLNVGNDADEGLKTDSVSIAPSTVDAQDATSDDSEDSFVGTQVAVLAGAGGEFEINGPDVSRERGPVDNSKVFVLDTDDFESGEYNFTDTTVTNEDVDATLDLGELGLEVSADPTNITTDETTEVTVSTDTNNRETTIQFEGAGETKEFGAFVDNDGEVTVEFDGGDFDPANYTITAIDNVTGVESGTTNVNIRSAADASSSFTPNSVSVPRGDIGEITVELTNTEKATVQVGQNSSGYNVTLTVDDGSDADNTVTIEWNTYQSVVGLQETDAANGGFSVVTEDDVDTEDQITNFEVTNDIDSVIAPESYRIRTSPTSVDRDTDIGTVTVSPSSLGDMRMWTAPGNDLSEIGDKDDVNAAVGTSITRDSTTANGDLLVHQITESSGLEGLFAAQNGDNTTDAFFNALEQDGQKELALTLVQDDPAPNNDANELQDQLGFDNTKVVADYENDTYYVIVDSDQLQTSTGLTDDGSYTATFTVNASGTEPGYIEGTDAEDDLSTNASFEVVEPTLEITQTNATASESGTVTAETNVAPGTSFRVQVQSTDDQTDTFFVSDTVDVQTDGTISATFSQFADRNAGETYEVIFDADNRNLQETAEGTLQEADATPTATPTTMGNMTSTETETDTPEPTDTETDTPEPTDTETDTPEPTETDEPTDSPEPTETEESTETEETTTSTGTPGFTAVVGVVALLGAALVALRRRN